MYHISFNSVTNGTYGCIDESSFDRAKLIAEKLKNDGDKNIEIREVSYEKYIEIENARINGTFYDILYSSIPPLEI